VFPCAEVSPAVSVLLMTTDGVHCR
jgi:hypothetical protein